MHVHTHKYLLSTGRKESEICQLFLGGEGRANDILLLITPISLYSLSPSRMKMDVGKVLQAGVLDDVS